VQAVQGLHTAALVGVDRLELGAKTFPEGIFNVSSGPPRRLGDARPFAQDIAGIFQGLDRIARQQTVMGEGEAAGASESKASQAVESLVEVEVGGRGRRAQDPGVGQPDAHSVADEKGPGSAVMERQMVLRMPR
jgi:hypothetical protein